MAPITNRHRGKPILAVSGWLIEMNPSNCTRDSTSDLDSASEGTSKSPPASDLPLLHSYAPVVGPSPPPPTIPAKRTRSTSVPEIVTLGAVRSDDDIAPKLSKKPRIEPVESEKSEATAENGKRRASAQSTAGTLDLGPASRIDADVLVSGGPTTLPVEQSRGTTPPTAAFAMALAAPESPSCLSPLDFAVGKFASPSGLSSPPASSNPIDDGLSFPKPETEPGEKGKLELEGKSASA
ncbi:hypothetical protein C8R47DRAFT_741900 [Mycena vitilis]|nr:hypothetical protein C8R47DRAFT_741900 [Mycena vitilis]